jgi:hypothetical protein
MARIAEDVREIVHEHLVPETPLARALLAIADHIAVVELTQRIESGKLDPHERAALDQIEAV